MAARQPLIGIRVLVVDDVTDSLELLRFVLSSAGADVAEASSARDAFDAIREHPPDVLVSDIAMPEHSGLDLIRWVRELPEPASHLSAIAVSGKASALGHQQHVRAGFDLSLSKPVDLDHLVAAVSQLAREEPQEQRYELE